MKTLASERITDTRGTEVGSLLRHAGSWVAIDDVHHIATEHESTEDAMRAVRARVASRWLAEHGVEVAR